MIHDEPCMTVMESSGFLQAAVYVELNSCFWAFALRVQQKCAWNLEK